MSPKGSKKLEEKRVRYKEEGSESGKEDETEGKNKNGREAKRRKRSVMEGKGEEGMVFEWKKEKLKVQRQVEFLSMCP